jgi:hypothetical protein
VAEALPFQTWTIPEQVVEAPPPGPGHAAQVIQLTPEEAAQAKALYAEKAAVEAKIGALTAKISEKYLWETCSVYPGCWTLKLDWYWGFEYSTDFRFIVPAQPKGTGCSDIRTDWPNWPETYVVSTFKEQPK